MAMSSGTMMRVVGIGLIVLGAGLAIWGWQMSDSVASQISQAVTGADTDRVMTLYIGGAVSFFVGIFLLVKG